MRAAGAVLRPGPGLPEWRVARRYLFTVLAVALLGLLVAAGPVWWRLLLAGTVALLLLTLMLTRPGLAILATFAYLVLLASLRRLLIAEAGWSSADPMLLVGPLVAIVAMVKLFALERRPLVPDALSKLVLVVLLLTFLEVVNPDGGGIAAGLAGLLFTAVPLFWFFVGRELLDDTLVDRVLGLFLLLGTAVAVYGLLQTEVGFPPWDVNWLNVAAGAGYSSLNVGNTVRAFGSFASSAEYALSVGAALVIAAAFVLRGRLWALLPMPILAIALFLASGRSALILAFLGVVIVAALRPRRPAAALAVTVVTLGAAVGALHFAGSGLAASSSSSLVSHQLGGITDPLNPSSSTLLLHLQLAWDGIKGSVHHPFGQGDAVTNNAAGVNPNSVTNQTQATEVDISNAFVTLGPLGGALYLITVLLVLYRAVTGYFAGRDALLAVIGVLVVALGQWLIGGDYALSPLCWLLIGAVAAGSTVALTRPTRPPAAGRLAPAGRR